MADDFNPDAFLATPAPPAAKQGGFNPDAFLADKPSGFDPDAFLKTSPSQEANPLGKYAPLALAVPGVGPALAAGMAAWPEIKRSATESWDAAAKNLGTDSSDQTKRETQNTPFWDITPQLRSLGRTGSGLLAAAGAPFNVATAPARSVIGHGMVSAEHGIGTLIAPETAAKDNLSEMYDKARQDVDTALSAMRPAGQPVKLPGTGAPAGPYEIAPSKPNYSWDAPPAPPASPAPAPPTPSALTPERNPLGVTLTEGEFEGDLAKRIAEQSAMRRGDPHAIDFQAQRTDQLAAARDNVASNLDPYGQQLAESPQSAADIVQGALDQHLQGNTAAMRQSEQALSRLHEANRNGLSPTNTSLARSPLDAADIVSGAVDNEAQRAHAMIDGAYEELRLLPGQFHPATFNNVGERIANRLRGSNTDPVNINPQTTPQASSALQNLDDILSSLKQTRDPDTGQVLSRPPLTADVVESARKRLNTFYGDALGAARATSNWSDVRAMRGVMNAFDNEVVNRLKAGTFTGGDPANVIEAMENARQAYSLYRKTFTPQGGGDAVGQAISKIVGKYEGQAATPEQIQGMLYGKGPLPVQVGRRLLSMFGANSPEIGAVKQGLYSYITERPPGAAAWGPEKVAERIDEMTSGAGRTLTQTYLSPDEIGRLKSFGQQLRRHVSGAEMVETDPLKGADVGALYRKVLNGDRASTGLLDTLRDRLTPNSAEYSAFKQGLFHHALQPVAGVEGWGPKKVGDNLYKLLANTRNSQVYSTGERQLIQSYADLMRRIEMPRGSYFPSAPGINPMLSLVANRVGQLIGALVGRSAMPGMPLVGEFAGITVGGKLEKFLEQRYANVASQLPLVANETAKYQKAMNAWNKTRSPGAGKLVAIAGSNLARTLQPLGIDLSRLQLPGVAPAQDKQPNNQQNIPGPPGQKKHGGKVAGQQHFAHGGRVEAKNIDRAPTEAQKAAGNYAKDHVRLHGLDITVENAKGAFRHGVGGDGKAWRVKMPAHYGYIKGTVGKDKDHVDVYLGPHRNSPRVFIIDQLDAKTKRFDEHKAFIGFGSEQQVETTYGRAFSDGLAHHRLGHLREMTIDEFKQWLGNGDTTKPIEQHQEKVGHSAAKYTAQASMPNEKCAKCEHFIDRKSGGPACVLVRSPISPSGWCRLFKRK